VNLIVPRRLVAVAAGLVLAAPGLRAAETSDLMAKATSWVGRPLEAYGIDVLDGIDQNEARIIGDWRILPVVAENTDEKILSYTAPVSDGLNWRIDIVTDAPKNESPRRGPLFISKISGRQFGKGWGNRFVGPTADLGAATCFINDGGSTATASVILKGLTQQGDIVAKASLLECVGRVVAKLNSAGNGLLGKVEATDIRVLEGETIVEFAKPGDPDRSWMAEITLRLKTPPR
jgi:hypothetical protein